jgi:hypothetical protein
MSEVLISGLSLPQLCQQCLVDLCAAIERAQLENRRIDFHHCEHRSVLILIGWKDGRPANLSLHSHMRAEDVVKLLYSAGAQQMQLQHVPVTRRPSDADTLN